MARPTDSQAPTSYLGGEGAYFPLWRSSGIPSGSSVCRSIVASRWAWTRNRRAGARSRQRRDPLQDQGCGTRLCRWGLRGPCADQCREAKPTAGLKHANGWARQSFAATRGASVQALLYSAAAAISATTADSMIIVFILFTCVQAMFVWLGSRAETGRDASRPGFPGLLHGSELALPASRLVRSGRSRPIGFGLLLECEDYGVGSFRPPH